MDKLTQPTLLTFVLQSIMFAVPILISYIAYRWVRVPLKRSRVAQALSLLQFDSPQAAKLERHIATTYGLRYYFWPLAMACTLAVVTYGLAHPYIVQQGLTVGIWEEIVDIFGAGGQFPRAILAGRIVFFGWMGAYIYSVQIIYRRFLSYDLTPSVYIFVANRFFLALVVGSIMGIALGTFSRAAGMPFDVNMVTVYIVTFFVGFFPEQGINWISATAKKALRQTQAIAKEKSLSDVEGLSIWHQGRLRQEGIENAQNLATADVLNLVVNTSFSVSQVIDWVDQAILLVYASPSQFEALENIGLRCASDVLTAAGDEKHLDQLAQAAQLDKNVVRMLHLALQSAPNIGLVARFRWQSSLDPAKNQMASTLPQPTVTPAQDEE